MLGVLPADTSGGADSGGISLQQATTTADDIFRNVIGARRYVLAQQRLAADAEADGGAASAETQSDSGMVAAELLDDSDDFITFEDVGRFFTDADDAERAFELLNGVNSTQADVVSKSDLITIVHSTFKDRKALCTDGARSTWCGWLTAHRRQTGRS